MDKPLRVLIVEDSEDDALLLLLELRKGGFAADYERVETPEAMSDALRRREWDIVISDYVMPRFSGLDALHVLRESGLDVPFIIVSGNIGEDLAVEAMRAGAHDYILKGNPARLAPAVARELRDAETRRERRKAEIALGESRERLINTLENITDGFFTLDHEWRFTYVNHAAERLWRRNRDTLIGKSIWADISPPSVNSIIYEQYHQAVNSGAPVAFEALSPLLNIWVDIRAYPVKEGLAVYIRDITERREAERRSALNNSLLQLFARTITKKEYLDAVVNLTSDWSGCKYAGIRLLGGDGHVPYASFTDFSPSFLETEGPLSIVSDHCVCTRVIAKKPEPQDLPSMTPYGSFYTNDWHSFAAGQTNEERTRFRTDCVQNGFRSVAVVPIRYRERVYGAIHLADERKDMAPCKNVEILEQMAIIIGEAIYRFGVEEDLIRQREELVRMNEQLRNLSAHVDAVREGERTNIAREIHDELGQILTAVKLDVSWLRNRLPKTQRKLLEKSAETLQIIDTAIQSVKRISVELRPGVLDDIGLAAAIEWAAKDFQKRTGIRCGVSVRPDTVAVDRTRSTALFRILQESLTNIMRHAQATLVEISLEEKNGAIVLKVTDNGKGIRKEELSDPHSFGLIGMRERVQFLGGRVEVAGVKNKGTIVTVSLPIESGTGQGADARPARE